MVMIGFYHIGGTSHHIMNVLPISYR